MARPLRVLFPGAVYHIMARGNEQQAIFRDPTDRAEFLTHLARAVDRYGIVCHSYCLMDNHYHALVETPRANLPIAMRHLNGCYSQAFNRRRQRVGHLFQGRYRAVLTEKDSHLLNTFRYIALNPTRTRPPIARRPEDWQWSSYPAYLGQTPRPLWLTTDWVLAQFAGDRPTARQRLKQFIADAPGTEEPLTNPDSVFYGSDQFIRTHTANLEPLAEIPRSHWQPFPPPLDAIFATDPDPIKTAYHDHGYTLQQIAKHLNRHYTTISRHLHRTETHQHKT